MSENIFILEGDSLQVLKELDENSVDSIVTDPPYGLKFMGKKWDYEVPSIELWKEALRVLKPGGHLLSFGGTRTYHRMVVNIEDAGFEIRDQIMWIYGSGFPKSTDVSKRIDKEAGAERELGAPQLRPDGSFRTNTEKVDGSSFQSGSNDKLSTISSTDSAKQWQGWGTALKPANEPICVARKPLEKGLTVAQNVLKYGTGALNIGASRIGYTSEADKASATPQGKVTSKKPEDGYAKAAGVDSERHEIARSELLGRWPANIIFDEEAAQVLDEQSGIAKAKPGRVGKRGGKGFGLFDDVKSANELGVWPADVGGGASRFFYVAKASKSERNKGLDSKNIIWETETWEKPDLNSLMENISQLAKAISDVTLRAAISWSTELFGKKSSAQFPPDLIFTISTALKLITELKTSNASQSLNTRENIQDVIKMIEASGSSLVESAESISQLLSSITNEKTASHLGVVLALLQMLSSIKGFAKSGNFHSTVKPVKLMEYLVRLITPLNGTVLDPFMGSGTTGVACKKLGFTFIGIELDPDYAEIARKRIG